MDQKNDFRVVFFVYWRSLAGLIDENEREKRLKGDCSQPELFLPRRLLAWVIMKQLVVPDGLRDFMYRPSYGCRAL